MSKKTMTETTTNYHQSI